MSNKAVKVTGTQVKELLAKATGGIYVGRGFNEILTDYFDKYGITDKGLEINANNSITLSIPIDETEQHINYAVGGEDLDADEEWEGSTYFDCKFCIGGYTVCFNVEDKGSELTWEQLKELVKTNASFGIFNVGSIDSYLISMHINDCIINFNEHDITFVTDKADIVLDDDAITAIYNDSAESGDIIYRLEFDNGMPDISIEIGYGYKLFK